MAAPLSYTEKILGGEQHEAGPTDIHWMSVGPAPPSLLEGKNSLMTERFSASSATRHMSCSASANLDLAIPHWVPPVVDPTADNAANRGTQMHEQFAILASHSPKDMWNLAKAAEYVAVLRQKRRFKSLIEHTVTAEWLSTKPSTQADLVLWVTDEIHVIDLKTGVIPVSPVENNQLMYYALAYGMLAPKAQGVHLHIVQPWADVMESWFASAARLALFKADTIATDQRIQAGDTTFSPGDHCQFCAANPHGRGAKGKPYCPAMMRLLYPQPEPDYDAMMGDT